MIQRTETFMNTHGIMPEKSVLIGLSGGADSAALLHIMCAIASRHGFKVYAAHVNHGLRAGTADRDEEYSRHLAESLGVEFFVLHADVSAESERLGISAELAGRQVRYDFFDKLMFEYDIEYTATAHHKNDNAETMLMNFMRGSGIKGLCGIPYKRGRIIRPILDFTRSEIEEYCIENNINYVIDETNLETVYTRNKIRHILVPEIEKNFNPSFVETVTKNARLIANEEDFISSEADKAAVEIISGTSADIDKLCGLHSAIALRVIRKMTEDMCGTADIPAVVIESVLKLAQTNRTGSRVDIARGAYAVVEYGRLRISNETADITGEFEYDLEIGQKTYIPECGYYILAEETKQNTGECFSVPEGARLRIRNRRGGDIFYPTGMSGRKKLKDFMINEKIPRSERDRVGIITVNDEIAWVVNHRRDRRFDFCKHGIKISVLY